MPSDNDLVQRTPFDAAQPSPPPQAEEKASVRQGTAPWVLPALGGLLLLAVLVIFWLPERVAPPAPGQATPEQAAADQTTTAGTTTPAAPLSKPAPGTTDASPWSEAQLAKLRKEAQEVLAELLDVQFALEERGAQQWAPERFAAAAAMAAAGDELYKTRQYEDAKARFQESLDTLQALQEAIPQELAKLLEQARQALEDGELEAAVKALDLAGVIEPNSTQLATLRQLAEVLQQLLPLLEEAAVAEQGGDLAAAQQSLQQATALDPQHLRARSELQRVAAALQAQRFNDAMSEGYTALDEARFAQAREAFRSAAKLQEGSSEAASALQEVETAATAHRLATLKQSGGKNEQKEQWQDAVSAYEQAQKIDGNVLFASEGLKRSRFRALLDKQFRTAIAEPQRLSDVAVADATAQLLKQAQQINPRGPVLEQQISRMQVLLRQANTPVAVNLRSDMETEVIVYKVARLGQFQQHQLTLRPGTYTAVGTRNGYRDVRQSFTIKHDSAPPSVIIACTEPI